MKRWMLVLVAAAMVLGTAGACDPLPPAGWVRPQVENLVVAPAPVVPGEPFTVAATLIDDHHIADVDMWFVSPNGQEQRFCDLPGFDPVLNPQTNVDVVIPCNMPAFAVNGTWTVVLSAYDGETFTGHGAGAGQAVATFEAVGGTNDNEPPVVDAFTIDPASPLQGQPFTITVTASDDHLVTPSGGGAMSYSNTHLFDVDCEAGPVQPLSPTQQEFVFACPGRPDLAAGPYTASFRLADLNANHLWHTVDFEIVNP